MEYYYNFSDLMENVIDIQTILENKENERRNREIDRINRMNRENDIQEQRRYQEEDANLYETWKVVLNEADAAMNEADINIDAVTSKVQEIETKTNALKRLYYNRIQGLIDVLKNEYIPKSQKLVVDILYKYVLSWERRAHYSENLDDFSDKFKFFPDEIKNICAIICVEMNRYIRKIRDEIQPRYDECVESYEKINAVEKKLITILKDIISYYKDRKLHGIYVEYSERLIRDLEAKIEDLKRYRRDTLSRFFENIFPEGIADDLMENVRSLQKGDGVPKKILDLFHDEGSFYEGIDIPIQFKIGPDIKSIVDVKYFYGLTREDVLNQSETYYEAYTENVLGYFKRMCEELEKLKNKI